MDRRELIRRSEKALIISAMQSAASQSAIRLWTAARETFARLRQHIQGVSLGMLLAGRGGKRLRAWLRALEALVRRIALTEALALPPLPLAKLRAARFAPPRSGQGSPPRFRLWPSTPPAPVRVRALGPATSMREVWKERRRRALAERLAHARNRPRRSPEEQFARRVAALERVLAKPFAVVCRLARKLHAQPRLAIKLAAARMPLSKEVDAAVQNEAAFLASCIVAAPNSS